MRPPFALPLPLLLPAVLAAQGTAPLPSLPATPAVPTMPTMPAMAPVAPVPPTEARALLFDLARARQRLLVLDHDGQPPDAEVLRSVSLVARRAAAIDPSTCAELTALAERLSGSADAGGDTPSMRSLLSHIGHLQSEMAHAAMTGREEVGYIGIDYAATPPRADRQGVYFYYERPPVIVSVEPGSPAERAGIEAGDTIVALDGSDITRHPVYMRELLRPGRRVSVRVRRDGETRELRVTVAPRPRQTMTWAMTSGDAPLPPQFRGLTTTAPPMGFSTTTIPGMMTFGTTGTMMTSGAMTISPREGSGSAFIFSTGDAGVAGAQLATMGEDLRQAFGVRERGVLVLGVTPGSPAAGSGLRGGDVIVAADGGAVVTPSALRRAVERASRRQLALDIVRRGERSTVMLRW